MTTEQVLERLGKAALEDDLPIRAADAIDDAIDAIKDMAAEIGRLRGALVDIRDHWANQYDHPRKENEMYHGSYGIGVTDGHRACTIIAERGLAVPNGDRQCP